MTYINTIRAANSASIDAFSRWRTSDPVTLFESTFRYDAAPLQFEVITSGGSATHSATDSYVGLTTGSAGNQLAALQSYRWIRYQPGKSQLVLITGVMGSAAANVTRRMGLFSATNTLGVVAVQNGIYLEQTGASTVNLCIANSGIGTADQTVAQAAWNIDSFNGAGPSGKTLDLSKSIILVIDFQWLGLGRVRVGFDFDGLIYYAHEFKNAGTVTDVYMQTATLPIRWELTSGSAAVSSPFKAICSAVVSEGGEDDISGYTLAAEVSGTAGNNARAHIGSIRPYVTFNSIINRAQIIPLSVETIVTGANAVLFELVAGVSGLSSGPTWAGVPVPYTYPFTSGGSASGVEATTAGGTINASATPIVIASWYCAANGKANGGATKDVGAFYPLTLNAAGANYNGGALSLYATGIGGTSACRASFQWKEIR